ncbi:MAG: tetratricopeptide repeat protein [Cyclobacteriaceae bacterium]|nr:tetratricopeptide repeat protein [Cyclobacteriaceae bacterium]
MYYTYSLSQNQKIADSLILVYNNDKEFGIDAKLELLHSITANHTISEEKIKYAKLLIEDSKNHNNDFWLYKGFMELGSGYRLQGDLDLALDSYLKCREAAQRINYDEGIGGAYAAIADIYSINNNNRNAILYYNQAIEILSKTTDSIVYATVLLNAGDEYFNSENYDSALLYFKESGKIFEKVHYPIGNAYHLGNIGMVYASKGQSKLAEQNINEAITILEELEDYYPISVYLTYMSDIYLEKGDQQTSLNYALRSLELAQQYGLKEQISDANLKLSQLYEQIGDLEESLKHYKAHIAFRDSVNNIETVQQMADLRTNFEVSQKQTEVDLLLQQKRNQKIIVITIAIALILICLLALGLYRRYLFIQKTNKIIEKEKNRSEKLLLNILPVETALELKENGRVQAKKFESTTVLFTDFREFTKFAEYVEPEQLIKSIDFYFKEFDEITTKYGLEKIKTIGDAYMCAGGLPIENQTHARSVIQAAKEMIEVVRRELLTQNDLIHFEIRIGVHTGPVIAGIVGTKKWQYDIWGDTVNIASRMESNSESGMVNLSETTYNEIKDEFPCEYRGELEVKNHGSMKMYFLS